jgi:hypothetical protein
MKFGRADDLPSQLLGGPLEAKTNAAGSDQVGATKACDDYFTGRNPCRKLLRGDQTSAYAILQSSLNLLSRRTEQLKNAAFLRANRHR